MSVRVNCTYFIEYLGYWALIEEITTQDLTFGGTYTVKYHVTSFAKERWNTRSSAF